MVDPDPAHPADRPYCAAFLAQSLDGYIARRDGSIDWLSCVDRPGEDYGYRAFFATMDAMVVGRGTWDKAHTLGAWPYAGKRCVVFTHRPADAGQATHDAIFVQGEPSPVLSHLHRVGVRRAYVDGGQLIRQFIAAGLLDELSVFVVPILLGEGLPLFTAGGPERPLALEATHAYDSGLVHLRYRLW